MLGDGYEVSIRFGLNNVRPEWQLTWETTAANATTIDNFLQARADLGEAFDWQPPDIASALRWRCDEWTVEHLVYNWRRVNATFRQVFEIDSTPDLSQYTYWRATVSFTDCDQTGPFTFASSIASDALYAYYGSSSLLTPTGAGDWIANRSLNEVGDFTGSTAAFGVGYRNILNNTFNIQRNIPCTSASGQFIAPKMTGSIKLYVTYASYDNDIPDFTWNGL